VRSSDGAPMGGFQAIMVTPGPDSAGSAAQPPTVPGFYRAGSDHRKDGQAVGY
jgi:gamma-glutamyltranspeptidase / glutathione hydrolase